MSNNFYLNVLGIKTELWQPNPCQTIDSDDDRRDCSVRALCKIFPKDYTTVNKELNEIGLEIFAPVQSGKSVTLYMARNGFIDVANMLYDKSLGEFMYNNKEGKFLLSNNIHDFAYINGVWYDSLPLFENYDTSFILTSDIESVFVHMNNSKFHEKILKKIHELYVYIDSPKPNESDRKIAFEIVRRYKLLSERE